MRTGLYPLWSMGRPQVSRPWFVPWASSHHIFLGKAHKVAWCFSGHLPGENKQTAQLNLYWFDYDGYERTITEQNNMQLARQTTSLALASAFMELSVSLLGDNNETVVLRGQLGRSLWTHGVNGLVFRLFPGLKVLQRPSWSTQWVCLRSCALWCLVEHECVRSR